MTLEPSRLHHLALGAQDVAALAEFYRDVLGLEELARHEESGEGRLRSVWLDLGSGGVLMIEKAERKPRGAIDGRDAGMFLLALRADAESLEMRCKGLEAMGIRQESASDFTRYFRDPEGNRFAFSCYPLPE